MCGSVSVTALLTFLCGRSDLKLDLHLERSQRERHSFPCLHTGVWMEICILLDLLTVDVQGQGIFFLSQVPPCVLLLELPHGLGVANPCQHLLFRVCCVRSLSVGLSCFALPWGGLLYLFVV